MGKEVSGMKIFFAGRTGFTHRERVVVKRGVRRRLLSFDQSDLTTVALPEYERVREQDEEKARKDQQ
jgi:hypothetical protein